MKQDNYQGHSIVFIVGSPRSGTTWLQRLLACHPQIKTGQESDIFDMYIGPQLRAWHRDKQPEMSGRGAIGLSCYFHEDEFIALVRGYMLRLLNPMISDLKHGELFIEKTPSHALFIPEIMELLPESRIIHVLRDGRDTVASLLAASKSWGKFWAPKSASAAANMWVKHVNSVREASRRINEDQFYELRYEDLHQGTENIINDVIKFLTLSWDIEGIKEAVEKNRLKIEKRGYGTNIKVQGEAEMISGPIVKEPDGFVRKGRPGEWKKDLSWKDKLIVWRIARRTMAEVGYYWRLPW